MRRGRRIVNEMEFRMLSGAKSFSPSARMETMKGFSLMHHPARRRHVASPASFLLISDHGRRTFSKQARR
jgi:hypothetical protein